MAIPALVAGLSLLVAGCSSYQVPEPDPTPEYLQRLEKQVDGEVSVAAVVLSADEGERVFAADLARKGIQPIWIEIENNSSRRLTLLANSIDPDYFSPSEAAWLSRRPGEAASQDKLRHFVQQGLDPVVAPYSTSSGFIHANLDPGGKVFEVVLSSDQRMTRFEFVQEVPGLQMDWMHVDFENLYQDDEYSELSEQELRDYLAALPCCVLGGDQKTPGDPLNIVVIGEGRHMLVTFLRQGWDMTETISAGSSAATAMSSLFRKRYRTSPVSPLFLFDRSHDLALQKARSTVDERNHLRLWLTPVTFGGQSVWAGQISRDIGVKLSSKTLVTHRIDPLVDEARYYLGADLASSQSVAGMGYVDGVGLSASDAPRLNYTRDPYFSDGLRLVVFLSGDYVPMDEIRDLNWETPPDIDVYFKDAAKPAQ